MTNEVKLSSEEKKKIQDQIGCPACKHYFTYYKHDDLCACSLVEIIDYVDGYYINFHGNGCAEWELAGDGTDWLANVDWDDD
jgi:hypothetical protein